MVYPVFDTPTSTILVICWVLYLGSWLLSTGLLAWDPKPKYWSWCNLLFEMIDIYICICVYVYTNVYIYMYIYIYIILHIHRHIHVHIQIHIHTHLNGAIEWGTWTETVNFHHFLRSHFQIMNKTGSQWKSMKLKRAYSMYSRMTISPVLSRYNVVLPRFKFA